MKTFKILMFSFVLTFALVSCEKDDNPFKNAIDETYPLDMLPQLAVSQQISYPVEGGNASHSLNGSFLFGAYPGRTSNLSVSCDANKLCFDIDENDDYTKDYELYINVIGKDKLSINHITFENYGSFCYPIHIRQQGEKGIRLMSASDLQNWSNSGYKPSKDYIKGQITEIGSVYAYPGSVTASEPYIRDQIIIDNALVECRDITVKTEDGAIIKVRLQELKRDKMIASFSAKVGDTAEIYVARATYNASFKGITNINVLDVYLN